MLLKKACAANVLAHIPELSFDLDCNNQPRLVYFTNTTSVVRNDGWPDWVRIHVTQPCIHEALLDNLANGQCSLSSD